MLAGLLALAWRRPSLLLLVAAADGLGQGLSALLRASIAEERPPLRYPRPEPLVGVPGSHSFPSGHTTSSFACATVLSWAAPRLAPLWYLLALAIGFSRVYVGVHYPFDVLGGAVLGVATALLPLAAARWRSGRARRAG